MQTRPFCVTSTFRRIAAGRAVGILLLCPFLLVGIDRGGASFPEAATVFGSPCLGDETGRNVSRESNATATGNDDLQITVRSLQISGYAAAQGRTLSHLAVQLDVHNPTDAPISLRRQNFVMTAGGQPTQQRINLGNLSASLPDQRLAPGATADGIIEFSGIDTSRGEPELLLTVTSTVSGADRQISINAELRRISAMTLHHFGPGNCLALIETQRSIDEMSLWLLSGLMRDAKVGGADRVVVAGTLPDNGVDVTSEAFAWLQTLREGAAESAEPAELPIVPIPNVRFVQLGLGNVNVRSRGRSQTSFRQNIVSADTTDAISRTLAGVYENMTPADAFADFHHSQAGVRHAAIRATVDRLNPEQRRVMLSDLPAQPDETLVEIAKRLHAIADTQTISALRDLSQHRNPRVSEAAFESLVQCSVPQTSAAVADVWRAAETDPALKSRCVDILLDTDDFRWVPILSSWGSHVIQMIVDGTDSAETAHSRDARDDEQSLRIDNAGDPPDADEQGMFLNRRATSLSARADHQQLMQVANYLMLHRDASVLNQARLQLLNVTDTTQQDLLATLILEYGDASDAELLRKFVVTRITSEQVTDVVISICRQFPDPRWSEVLLQRLESSVYSSRNRIDPVESALRSMSSAQRNALIERFESLKSSQKIVLLEHLSIIQHPRWHELAEQCLAGNGSLLRKSLDTLLADGSEESLAIMNRNLLSRLELVKQDDDGTQQQSDVRELLVVMSQVGMSSHPECHRVLNLCARHPNASIREQSEEVRAMGLRRSPARASFQILVQQREDQQFDEALKTAHQCVADDPVLPYSYLYRASLLMRTDQLDAAMEDLVRADRLSPEYLPTVNTIALLKVRQGKLAEGLRQAEEVLAMDSDDSSNLYNTACVYARAAEQVADDPTAGTKHADRSFELLNQSVQQGFDDLPHIQSDPDLESLHSDPRFQDLLKQVENNASQKADSGDKAGFR